MTDWPQSEPNPNSNPTATGASLQARDSSLWIRRVVFVALFGALFIAGSYIKLHLGFTTVPISLQTFAVMLAGGLLGASLGFASIAIVVVLTALGLPLMSGSGGLAQLFGPTGGFIWMFPFSALLIGFVADRLFAPGRRSGRLRPIALLAAAFGFGALLVYASGIPWYAHVSKSVDLSGALSGAMFPFIPGDIAKAVVATIVIVALRPYLPRLR